MELLAPAGSVETFHAALDGGADALYVGAPGINARNLTKDLRHEEIGAMISTCRDLDKKIYIAANSLVLEPELPEVIESLAILEEMGPDGIIVQDLGLLRLVKLYYPKLSLHGSTLMTVHNSQGVKWLEKQGCERVVLGRELSLEEISAIANNCPKTELEIFIHGAMCFSYSGLCLFSSYLGGKSGLRGRCVQPCRRGYLSSGPKKHQRKSSSPNRKYLFSMNDLSGLDAIAQLKEIGISSLKIEGRLRSAHYVHSVVKAYRMVIDALQKNNGDMEGIYSQAKSLLDQAMSRKTSGGYFFVNNPLDAISPHHSGSLGIHIGRIQNIRTFGTKQICKFTPKTELEVGDRIRLQKEPSGERRTFRLKSLFVQGESVDRVDKDIQVTLQLPDSSYLGSLEFIDLYKIDSASQKFPQKFTEQVLGHKRSELKATRNKVSRYVQNCIEQTSLKTIGFENSKDQSNEASTRKKFTSRKRDIRKLGLQVFIKSAFYKDYRDELGLYPDKYIIPLNRQNAQQAGRIKSELGRDSRKIVWALPPIIFDKETQTLRKLISNLIRSGYRSFQLSHISQQLFFEKTESGSLL